MICRIEYSNERLFIFYTLYNRALVRAGEKIMSERWKAHVTLVGSKLPQTVMSFDLNVDEGGLVSDQFNEANTALTSIVTALEAVTTANVIRASVTYDQTQSGTLGSGDVTDEAAVSVYLNGAGELTKLHTIRIPAPEPALFTAGDANKVDITNPNLITYVGALQAYSFVSDGEIIQTAVQNGIDGGYWRSVSRSTKAK